MTKQKMRRRILKVLYEKFCEHPYHSVTPKEFTQQLSVDRRDLDCNMIYLERKGLIELDKPLEGDIFVAARISPRGIDLVEDEYALETTFPDKPLPPPGDHSRVIKALEDIRISLADPGPDDDMPLSELIEGLALELGKPEPSYRQLGTLFDTIRARDQALGKKIAAVLRDPSIARLLANSARRELLDS
jgi:hypothetical protein